MMIKQMKTQNIPTTADAESWLDIDHFIYKGKVWIIKPDFSIEIACKVSVESNHTESTIQKSQE